MTTTATEKVHVIRQLPAGNSPSDRTERAHLQASRWRVPGAPKGEALAGRPYLVTVDIAANLIRKGWTLCDATGKPTGAELPKSDTKAEIRPGTEAWWALPAGERPGTEEYRAAELDRRIHAAYLAEQEKLTEAHAAGGHNAGAVPDCPLCAAGTAAVATEAAPAPFVQADAPQGATGASDDATAGAPTRRARS